MKCLELLGILKSFIEKGEGILTAALLNLSALPVHLLRQVYPDPLESEKPVFLMFFEDGAVCSIS